MEGQLGTHPDSQVNHDIAVEALMHYRPDTSLGTHDSGEIFNQYHDLAQVRDLEHEPVANPVAEGERLAVLGVARFKAALAARAQ